jgi:DNA-binding GntR family transcriptional regulator
MSDSSNKSQPAPVAAHVDGQDDSPWRQRFETIYKALRRRIVLLEYPPGTRLDVAALAKEFDVSRTPIRTVIQRLENEGLAITRHGVGTAVTDVDVSQVRDVWLFRLQLAEMMSRLSPRPGRVAVIELLERLHAACQALDSGSPTRDFALIDVKLHDFKCNLIGNLHLRRTYDEMYYRSVRAWFLWVPRLDFKTEQAALLADISQTMNAVRRGDVAAVGFITRNALSEGLYRLDTLITQCGDET